MTNLEIKRKIDFNNKLIEDFLSLNKFVLNSQVAELLAENSELQKQCTHNFIDGVCEYCYKMEE